MSTIRATYVQHGSSPVPNITLNASGQVIVASGIVSSGTFAAPSGNAPAPGIYFIGDADTGLYSAGANQFAIATSGTGRLFVSASGRVGIGNDSPVNTLDVYGSVGVIYDEGVQLVGRTATANNRILGHDFSGGKDVLNIAPAGNAISEIAFKTFNGASLGERARIDSSGRLLVGTSTARTNLFGVGLSSLVQIEGSSPISSIIRNDNTSSAPYLIFGKSRSTGNTAVQNGDITGIISFQNNDGTNFLESAYIAGFVSGTPGTNDLPTTLIFATAPDGSFTPAERLRICETGAISINYGASVLPRLFVAGTNATAGSFSIYNVNNAGNYLFATENNGTFYTGNSSTSPYNYTTVTAANVVVDSAGILYRSTSSARFKTDIETLEDSYADNVLNCRPVWYRSTSNADDPAWGWWGFIAEEVAEVDPRLVFWKTKEKQLRDDYVEEEGKLPQPEDYIEVNLENPVPESVQYDRFVPHLLNLVKRQQQAIEDLQLEVAALKNQ